MDITQFAKLLSVDNRTIRRWESGESGPTGTANSVLLAIKERLEKNPYHSECFAAFVAKASAVGGLPYLFLKLFEYVPIEGNHG